MQLKGRKMFNRLRGFEFVDNVKNINCNARIPTRATAGSIGYDFYSPISTIVQPHQNILIWTDIKSYFPDDEALIITVRSSMGKDNIMLANTMGVIDSSYYNNEDNEGNIGINLYNYGEKPYCISAGDRIAQGLFVKCALSYDKPLTKRKGGFGSTN